MKKFFLNSQKTSGSHSKGLKAGILLSSLVLACALSLGGCESGGSDGTKSCLGGSSFCI